MDVLLQPDVENELRFVAILNCTPDSFSDGGELSSIEKTLVAAQKAIEAGAFMLEVGGESTRPGALAVEPEEELRRILPAIEALHQHWPQMPLCVDTRKAVVAQQALAAGANWVNDVSGLAFDGDLAGVVAKAGAGLTLMHSQGLPQTMQQNPQYEQPVTQAVRDFLVRQTDVALAAGINPQKLWWDPGFGFGKTLAHNLELLNNLQSFSLEPYPALVGLSRKSFLALGQAKTIAPKDREGAGVLAFAQAYGQGVRHFRVHEVGLYAAAARFLLQQLALK